MRSLCLTLLLLVSAACAQRTPSTENWPAPTEHFLDADAEAKNKKERKAWYAERHWADADTDWRQLERNNREFQRTKRNQLSQMMVAGNSRWTEIGSRNQAGRMHVAQHSPDGTELYAGSSKGGVWRGSLNGTNWTNIGDNIGGGAHWMAVVPGATPSDPNIVMRATDGGEIHRTIDDGASWTTPAGLPSVSQVRRVFTSADGSNTVFIVVRYWQSGYKYGLYRSTNGAANFIKVKGMNTFAGDAWMPRNGAGDIYLVNQNGTHRSSDLGDTWQVVGTIPAGATQAELTASEAGAPRLYGVFTIAGDKRLHRSDNEGTTWSFTHTVTDYWGTLNASIVDEDLVAYGGVEVWRSTNGGDNFSHVNGWGEYYGNPAGKLHADIPGLDVVPGGPNGEIWYISTDGGLFRSTNGLFAVENLSLDGLRVSQYYTTLTSKDNSDEIVAGAQDQGWQWADQPAAGPGTIVDFEQLISGDYGHAVATNKTHAYVYSVYPGFILIHKGLNGPNIYTTDFPANENYPWLPALAEDPTDRRNFFFCASRLYHYVKGSGNFWTYSQWGNHSFEISNNEHLTGLAWSPLDSDRGYAITNVGRLWYTNDRGLTWTQSANNGPSPHYFYGTAIEASPIDLDTVWVGGSGYSGPAVYRSTDGGATFQAYGQGLPPTLIYSLAASPDTTGTIYAGGENAAYRRRTTDTVWQDITENDAPVNIYWSAEAVADLGVIRFGTYGRGIWDYQTDAQACAYEAYGVGMGGANTLSLDTESLTILGTSHTYVTSGAPATSLGFLVVSPSSNSSAFLGGTLLVGSAGSKLFAFGTDAGGVGSKSLTIPDDASLAGIELFFQTILFDPLQASDWAFSNGLSGRICE